MSDKGVELGWYINKNENSDNGLLPPIFVSREKWYKWLDNCFNNVSRTSWIYFKNLNNLKRQVKLDLYKDDFVLIYRGVNKNEWGYIVYKD
jgi:hypothetical protein